MNYTNIFLNFKEEFNAFCVSDKVINKVTAGGSVPLIQLQKRDYTILGGKYSETAPTIGFLLGRETGFYAIDYNYAKAIVQSGVNIRFLTYKKVAEQMEGLCGLILPGGAFSSPDEFYADGQKLYEPNSRYKAYETAICTAEQQNMPILGICAGAQMIAALHGMKLWRNVPAHKCKEREAHKVRVCTETILQNLLSCQEIVVNSRHREAVKAEFSTPTAAEDKGSYKWNPADFNTAAYSGLQLYATAEDNIPEAWGNEEKGILCIQWHPEDFAANGDLPMQNIYNWLAKRAENYSKK